MICLFLNGECHLLLRNVERDINGSLKSGVVVNGIWNFEIRNGEVLAKSGNDIVARRPLPDYVEVEIPANIHGDYSEIMNWAERILNEERRESPSSCYRNYEISD